MREDFIHAQYNIINLENNNYLGLQESPIENAPYPPPPIPVILLHPGILPHHKFEVEQVNGENNTYVLLIKNTRCEIDRVYDFGDEPEKWVVRYREHQDAYTIEKTGETLAWTAPPGDEDIPQVLLRPLTVMSSNPPQFPDSQLFTFDGPAILER